MHRIERYIFRRVFTISISTLIGTTALVIITQLLGRLKLLIATSDTLITFLKIGFLLIPTMTLIVMPFALWIGATRVLHTMNIDSELVVLEAAGASRRYVYTPIIVLGGLMSLVGILISHFAEPWAGRELRHIVTEARSELFSSAVRSGEFTEIRSGVFIQISKENPDGSFGGLFVADQRDPNLETIYYSITGVVVKQPEGEFIVMNDGEIHRKPRDTGVVSTVRFESYVLDLSFFGSTGGDDTYGAKERYTGALLNPDPNDTVYQKNPESFRAEIHSRFSEWIYPLVFGLIALYFTGKTRSSRQTDYLNSFLAAVSVFGVRGLGFLTISQAGGSVVFASLSYVVPIGCIALIAALTARDW